MINLVEVIAEGGVQRGEGQRQGIEPAAVLLGPRFRARRRPDAVPQEELADRKEQQIELLAGCPSLKSPHAAEAD